MTQKTTHWAQVKQIGPYWGMRFVLLMQKVLGTRLCLLLITPVVAFYFLCNRHGRAASMDYLKRLNQFQRGSIKPSLVNSFRHFLAFTEAMLDKLATWNSQLTINDVTLHGREQYIGACIEGSRGAIILGSHLGNIEVSRALASVNNRAKLNVLMHTKHAQTFNRLIEHVSGSQHIELIEVTEISPAIAIVLQQKIDQGEFVCIVGDRVPVNSHGRTVQCNFLGQDADFAQGPFILASLLKCPVYTLFCLKEQGRYQLYFEAFADKITLARKDREASIQQYAQQFAQRLERYCLKAPLQWFNFYFYWQDNDNGSTGTDFK